MELKEDMYVRTKDGFIDKVIINYKGCCNSPTCNCKHVSCEHDYYDEEAIVKTSDKLIDLIELGDYVNGDLVTFISSNPQKNQRGKHRIILNDSYSLFSKYDDIKSIVTKEMFNSVKYEVE